MVKVGTSAGPADPAARRVKRHASCASTDVTQHPAPPATPPDGPALRVLLIDDGAHRVGLIRDELSRQGLIHIDGNTLRILPGGVPLADGITARLSRALHSASPRGDWQEPTVLR